MLTAADRKTHRLSVNTPGAPTPESIKDDLQKRKLELVEKLEKHGVNQHSGGVGNTKSSEGGMTVDYTVGRLKRDCDHPDAKKGKGENKLGNTKFVSDGGKRW